MTYEIATVEEVWAPFSQYCKVQKIQCQKDKSFRKIRVGKAARDGTLPPSSAISALLPLSGGKRTSRVYEYTAYKLVTNCLPLAAFPLRLAAARNSATHLEDTGPYGSQIRNEQVQEGHPWQSRLLAMIQIWPLHGLYALTSAPPYGERTLMCKALGDFDFNQSCSAMTNCYKNGSNRRRDTDRTSGRILT